MIEDVVVCIKPFKHPQMQVQQLNSHEELKFTHIMVRMLLCSSNFLVWDVKLSSLDYYL